jgi:DNA-binding NarL/FixJ family response regulator
VADDHPLVLEAVSKHLEAEFDVVGTAADGRSAVDAALRLKPDLVVVDLTMPELNGFGATQELKRLGSQAKTVFLTMHDGDEYVAAAVEAGAHGYVLKSRLQPDLVSALRHALADRLFVPSLTSLLMLADNRSQHAAHFYGDESRRLDNLSRLLGAALRRGDAVVVAGTDATRAGVATRLAERNMDIDGLTERGRYIPVDAAEALSQFMRNRQPDAGLLSQFTEQLERTRLAKAEGSPQQLTVCGEMAALLYQEGNTQGAISLEGLWSRLTSGRQVFTVCEYPHSCFEGEAGAQFFSHVCQQHGSVNHSPSTASAI